MSYISIVLTFFACTNLLECIFKKNIIFSHGHISRHFLEILIIFCISKPQYSLFSHLICLFWDIFQVSKCKKSIIYLTFFVKYFFRRIYYSFTYLVLQVWYVYAYIMPILAKSSIACIESAVIHQVVHRYHCYVRLATKFVLTTRK